jgi:hypothetical protein
LDEAFSTVIMHKGVFSVNRGEKGAYASPLPELGEGPGVRAGAWKGARGEVKPANKRMLA